MDEQIKRKIRIVLIAFIIVSIPIGYFAFSSIKLDKAYEAWEKAIIMDSSSNIEIALDLIENAERYVFYDKNLKNIKVQLLYRKKDYRHALKCMKSKESYIYKGLLYEHLQKSDSAQLCYEKAIPVLKKQLEKNKDNIDLVYELERQIALFYTFLNQTENAKDYLQPLPNNYDPIRKEMILKYDFYIEEYISGGYKDFLEGETVLYGVDSIPKTIDIDSLMKTNKFYFVSHTTSGENNTYEIKKIFEHKAISLGMNKKKQNPTIGKIHAASFN